MRTLLYGLLSFFVLSSADALVVKRNTIWTTPTLTVVFLSGSQQDKELVKTFASVWTKFANINFEFYNFLAELPRDKKADIRVNISRVRGTGAAGSSLIGNQARWARNGSTMELNMGSEAAMYNFHGVVVHEFGHALGLQHEHQHGERTFSYDEEKFLADCRSRNQEKFCRDQHLQVFDHTDHDLFPYDPQSIMHYSVPEKFALNVPAEAKIQEFSLSLLDKLAIADIYPGRLGRAEIENQHAAEVQEIQLTNSFGKCFIQQFMGSAPDLGPEIFTVYGYRIPQSMYQSAVSPSKGGAILNMKYDRNCAVTAPAPL